MPAPILVYVGGRRLLVLLNWRFCRLPTSNCDDPGDWPSDSGDDC